MKKMSKVHSKEVKIQITILVMNPIMREWRFNCHKINEKETRGKVDHR